MMSSLKVGAAAFVMLVVLSVAAIAYHMIDIYAIIGSIGVLVVNIGTIFTFVMLSALDQKTDKIKQDFGFCLERTNIMLRQRSGGNILEWGRGRGFRSEILTINQGMKQHSYRSFYGFMSVIKQHAVIVYDINKDDIARIYVSPSPQVVGDPFYEFKPFFSPEALGHMRTGQGVHGQKGLTIHYNDGTSPYNEPDADFVDRALDRGKSDGASYGAPEQKEVQQ